MYYRRVKNRLHFSTQIKNSEGPVTDPCGTPQNTLEISEKEFSKFIENF